MSRIAITNVLTLHEATGNVLVVCIEEQNTKNIILKEIIKMLENSLNFDPLLMTPIRIRTQQSPIPTTSTSHGSIGALKLVNAVKCHRVSNIC